MPVAEILALTSLARVCGCGHPAEGHHRGTALCRKVFCPCNAFHLPAPGADAQRAGSP